MANPAPAPTTAALDLDRKRPRLRVADMALAALVMLVVGLMVVPLPTHLLDFLIARHLVPISGM